MTEPARSSFDTLTVGGGPAGRTVAVYRARFRRSVLFIDAGPPLLNGRVCNLRVNGPAGSQLRFQLGPQWLRLRHEPPVVFDKPALDQKTRLHSCNARAKLPPEFWSLTHLRLILWHLALQLGATLAPRASMACWQRRDAMKVRIASNDRRRAPIGTRSCRLH